MAFGSIGRALAFFCLCRDGFSKPPHGNEPRARLNSFDEDVYVPPVLPRMSSSPHSTVAHAQGSPPPYFVPHPAFRSTPPSSPVYVQDSQSRRWHTQKSRTPSSSGPQ
ncbi:hypothetical protein IEO21_06151 [Rhodonia placenta]|uniref:Uncharacterized protein n=1 Tax=Rhodonia placenta TaxID=104341 RepID=A0A8H7U0W7_9APHY|nr:hypothetical protein IEO21_06151 [Postia placenta]